ncbi:MAG: hypothetical protein L0Z54_05495 [Thermoplasmata archaeon]|nr:hypothetical protein [Thermoplasmata archaeon]
MELKQKGLGITALKALRQLDTQRIDVERMLDTEAGEEILKRLGVLTPQRLGLRPSAGALHEPHIWPCYELVLIPTLERTFLICDGVHSGAEDKVLFGGKVEKIGCQ